jgi:hypothetical protein
MQEIHNEVSIGLKFRVNDFITMMTENNYATYRYLLRKVNISGESTDEINRAYKDIIHDLDPFFEHEEFLERITNVPTESFGNVNILNCECVLEVNQIHFGQQSFHPRGNNIQTIPLDIMMQALDNSSDYISFLAGASHPFNFDVLPHPLLMDDKYLRHLRGSQALQSIALRQKMYRRIALHQ